MRRCYVVPESPPLNELQQNLTMQLHRSTWPDIQQYLSRSNAVLIPTGSTEQHGPGGVIGTDAICAEYIALEAATGRQDMLVAPTLALAPAQFNLDFPGTISVRSTTFVSIVMDTVDSLTRSGFRRFYFLNGHGANIPALRCAIHDLHQATEQSGSTVAEARTFCVQSWWDFAHTNRLRETLFADGEGMHATPSELSIVQHVLTERNFSSTAAVFSPLDREFFRRHAQDTHDDAKAHRKRFPLGHVGSRPDAASAKAGAELLTIAARELVDDWLRFTAVTSK